MEVHPICTQQSQANSQKSQADQQQERSKGKIKQKTKEKSYGVVLREDEALNFM